MIECGGKKEKINKNLKNALESMCIPCFQQKNNFEKVPIALKNIY